MAPHKMTSVADKTRRDVGTRTARLRLTCRLFRPPDRPSRAARPPLPPPPPPPKRPPNPAPPPKETQPVAGAGRTVMVVATMAPVSPAGPRAARHSPTTKATAEAGIVSLNVVDVAKVTFDVVVTSLGLGVVVFD